jgi:hypothetical protein
VREFCGTAPIFDEKVCSLLIGHVVAFIGSGSEVWMISASNPICMGENIGRGYTIKAGNNLGDRKELLRVLRKVWVWMKRYILALLLRPHGSMAVWIS